MQLAAAGVLGIDEAVIAEYEISLIHGVSTYFLDLALLDQFTVGLNKISSPQTILQQQKSFEVILQRKNKISS